VAVRCRSRSRRSKILLALSCAVVASAVAGDATSAATSTAGRGARRPDPVVLVHGYRGAATNWDAFTGRLVAAGHRADEIVALDYDSSQSNALTAQQLAATVADLRTRTGARRVDVVSHSMGALSARWFVQELAGSSKVDAWVSIGGADTGTWYGLLCVPLVSCRELLPGSAFQERLGSTVDPAGRTRFGAWWSPCDAVIERTHARLLGARNVETSCLAHASLLDDATTADQVQAFIDERRSPRSRRSHEQVFVSMLGR
jgi:triacylglycerol lipase